MPAQSLQTEAFVLLRRPAAESFQSCTLFSAEHGVLVALQRASRQAVALDLFDEAALVLESSNERRTWFVREAGLLRRSAAIGRSYEALRGASRLAGIVARNPVPPESRGPTAVLLRAAFAAFAASERPDVVLLKGLYRFALEEGYPVREHWLASLPAGRRDEAERLLRTPLAALDLGSASPSLAAALQLELEEYLRRHTEILID